MGRLLLQTVQIRIDLKALNNLDGPYTTGKENEANSEERRWPTFSKGSRGGGGGGGGTAAAAAADDDAASSVFASSTSAAAT